MVPSHRPGRFATGAALPPVHGWVLIQLPRAPSNALVAIVLWVAARVNPAANWRRKPFRGRSLRPLVGTLGRGWSHTGHRVYCPRPSHARPPARNATARDAANGFDTRFREPAGDQLSTRLQDVPDRHPGPPRRQPRGA